MPVEAVRYDGNGVSGYDEFPLRFTPKALFLYTTFQPGDGTTDNSNGNGAEFGLGFAIDDGTEVSSTQRWNPIVIMGQGTLGSNHVASATMFGDSITWDTCNFKFNGGDLGRIGGLAFGGDTLEYALGEFELPANGDPVTVSGLAFEPQVVMLIRYRYYNSDSSSSQVGCAGLGVSNGVNEWFSGDIVYPHTWGGGGPGFQIPYIHNEFYDNGCCVLPDIPGDDIGLIYSMSMEADGFTLTPVAGSLGTPEGDWAYFFLALYDPEGEFDVGVLTTTGDGASEVLGVATSPDALLTMRSNRTPGKYRFNEWAGVSDDLAEQPLITLGTDDRYPGTLPRWTYNPAGDAQAIFGLIDLVSGGGAFAVAAGGNTILLVTDGVDAAGDFSSLTTVDGDELRLTIDGDDFELFVNGVPNLAVTTAFHPDFDADPSRVFIATNYDANVPYAIDSIAAGPLGTPVTLDLFNRANAADLGASWTGAPIIAGPSQPPPGVRVQAATAIDVDQAAYWNEDSYPDETEIVIVLKSLTIIPGHGRHNAWAHYVQMGDGFNPLWSYGYMGGHDHDTLIGWTRTGNTGTYPYGPFIQLGVDHAGAYGLRPTGFRLLVDQDTGEHRVGWFLSKTSIAEEAAECGFPIRKVQQIYRRL